jgi:choline dehydrogenase-like flavoprotein
VGQPLRLALRWLSRAVYGGCLPGGAEPAGAGVERYLEDLWRDAPWPVALGHTLTALMMCAAPLALGHGLRPFPALTADEQGTLLARLLQHPWYPARLLAFTVRGNALVAALRDPHARAAFLSDGDRPPAPARPAPRIPGRGGSGPTPAGSGRAPVADYVIVGSGAAGATAAVLLGEQGRDTIVLEEGAFHRTDDFGEDLYGAMATLFRDFGAQVARGRAIFPVLEGRCIGGSTVMNGAIAHRLPKEVLDRWCHDDAAIAASLRFADLEAHATRIEEDLGIRANLSGMLEGLPAAAALRRLGWAHQAMRRSAPGCQASGRCLQGCPSGGKLSMEASYIPRAMRAGVRVFDRHRATGVVMVGGRAAGVAVRDPEGRRQVVGARRAVILAAGALRSPLLLRASKLGGAHTGRHFQCHLGVGTTALLDRPVRSVEGPPQGIEVLEFDADGLKLATQLLPPELLLARTPVAGRALADLLRQWRSVSSWTGSVRSEAEGWVSGAAFGRVSIHFDPIPRDMERLRDAVWRMAQLLFELGAVRVFPGVFGVPAELRARGEVGAIRRASLDPRAYLLGVGHLFGTCRMGGDPAASVVAPDFRVHGAQRLYVVDASVFPSNIGVNPQLAIMTLARQAAQGILGQRD